MIAVFQNADFVFLTETRTEANDLCLTAQGFDTVNYTHTLPGSETTTTHTGGIAFCVRSNLAHALRTQPTLFAPSMLHVHLNGTAINLDRDLHLIGVYMLHAGSKQRNPDAWFNLAAKLQSLPKDHYVVLLGDMNARTANLTPDVCTCINHSDEDASTACGCVCERISEDTAPVNQHGSSQLLDVCTSMNLCVLNGLTRMNNMQFSFADSECMTFNSHGGNGSSVADYICMDARLLSRLCHFNVCTEVACHTSDHYPLVCYISNPPPQHSQPPQRSNLPSRKIKWSETVRERLCDALPHDAAFLSAANFFQTAFLTGSALTPTDLQRQYSACIDSIHNCATGRPPAPRRPTKRSFRHKPRKEEDGPAYIAQTKWHDARCFHLRRVHRTLRRRAVRARRQGRSSTHANVAAHSALKHYLSVCKAKRKAWIEAASEQVDDLVRTCNNKTWKYVDEVINDKRRTDAYAPPVGALTAHFSKVFSPSATTITEQPSPATTGQSSPASGQPSPGQPSPGQPSPGQPSDRQPSQETPSPVQQNEGQPSPGQQTPAPPEHVTVEEVKQVLSKVKRDKAGGWDGIPPALLADLKTNDWFVQLVHHMCNVFVRNAFWPKEWNEIIIAPIPKAGKRPDLPDSYRPIHLICVLAKCVSSLVERKIRASVEQCCEQLGFQTGSGTRDNVFVLQQLIRKYRKHRLFTCFVDFKMAFDSVDRGKLFDKLERIPGIDAVWIRMLRAMYANVSASIKGSGVWFPETIGVKQGDPLSPLLFILYISDLPQAIVPTDGDGKCSATDQAFVTTLADRIVRSLLYADDLALPSRTEAGLQQMLNRLRDYCDKWQLTVNVSKTEVVVFDSSRKAAPLSAYTLFYNGERINCVEKFRYVGIWFNRTGRSSDIFQQVLSSSRRALYKCMGRVSRLEPIPVALKISLFNAYVRPVMLYCAEALPITKTQSDELDSLQLKYVRWCLGRLPASSPKVDTLAEVGQRPVSYELTKASINYYLLTKRRPAEHITTVALTDALTTSHKQESWWRTTQGHMQRVGWNIAVDDFSVACACNVKGQRKTPQTTASYTRRHCARAWTQRLIGPPVSEPEWCTDTASVNEWLHTHVLPAYVTDSRASSGRLKLFPPTYRKVAPYVKSCMSPRLTRVICMFRLGIVQLHSFTGGWSQVQTHLFARTCSFCQHECQRHVLEDAYHVCMECPLYDHMRMRIYNYLHDHNFDFTPIVGLQDLYVAMLNCADARTIRAIGGFLLDCLAARDSYLGHIKESQWLNTRRQAYITQCVRTAPTHCQQSTAQLLRCKSDLDTSYVPTLATHLQAVRTAKQSHATDTSASPNTTAGGGIVDMGGRVVRFARSCFCEYGYWCQCAALPPGTRIRTDNFQKIPLDYPIDYDALWDTYKNTVGRGDGGATGGDTEGGGTGGGAVGGGTGGNTE